MYNKKLHLDISFAYYKIKRRSAMKRLATALALIPLLVIVAAVYAEEQGGNPSLIYCPYCGQYLEPRGGYYGMGPGNAASQGMMGKSYGMGSGMIGGGLGGYGLGPGMLRGEIMGPGYYGLSSECRKFLDETVGLRKKLYNKRYEYFEALKNPGTTPGTAENLHKEIDKLEQNISSKTPGGCSW
jgi:hypothetical protein